MQLMLVAREHGYDTCLIGSFRKGSLYTSDPYFNWESSRQRL